MFYLESILLSCSVVVVFPLSPLVAHLATILHVVIRAPPGAAGPPAARLSSHPNPGGPELEGGGHHSRSCHSHSDG